MGIDVTNYGEVASTERLLFPRGIDYEIGRFNFGSYSSQRLGDGLEIDGLREHVPGDEARHIDWIQSTRRSDGVLLVRQHYAEKAPFTVVVSDIPNEKYSSTPGVISAQSLGFVLAHGLLRSAANHGSPVLGVWSNGYESQIKPRIQEGGAAAKFTITQGLNIAQEGLGIKEASRAVNQRAGLLRRRRDGVSAIPPKQSLAETLQLAVKHSGRISDVARFVIISDFFDGIEEVAARMRALRGKSEILAIQVTNPLLRELPTTVQDFGTVNRGFVIESEAQRKRYAELVAEKQQRIEAVLKAHTDASLRVDTSEPEKLAA